MWRVHVMNWVRFNMQSDVIEPIGVDPGLGGGSWEDDCGRDGFHLKYSNPTSIRDEMIDDQAVPHNVKIVL